MSNSQSLREMLFVILFTSTKHGARQMASLKENFQKAFSLFICQNDADMEISAIELKSSQNNRFAWVENWKTKLIKFDNISRLIFGLI